MMSQCCGRPDRHLYAHIRLRRRRGLESTSLSPQAVRQSTQHRSHLPLPITKAFGEILSLKRQSFSLIHPIAIPCPKHACFNRTAGFQGYSRLRIGRALSISLQNSLIPGNSSPRRACRRLHPPPVLPSEMTGYPRFCQKRQAIWGLSSRGEGPGSPIARGSTAISLLFYGTAFAATDQSNQP